MAKSTFFLLICAAIIVVVRADGLSDFSNNLASDLGPLLSLFGEAVTRQYLSESTTFIDYFIFAMAPIGIISTITAVIRVCGSSSLRAFIGRAQEGQGATEAELCTSTSGDVCELFNKGGITRVLGRPDIIELVYISGGGQANKSPQKEQQKEQQQTAPQKLQLFTSYLENCSDECWKRKKFSGSRNAVFDKIGHSDSGSSLDLAPKPNLSLNVGIRRQPGWVFYVIALVGFILQAGILVFAGTAVWLLEWNLQKPNSEASRNYAPGIFIAGTITLCLGVWSCAALIGQTTNEQYYERRPASSDVLYWIQPGPQVIGDQSFGSFAHSDAKRKDRLMTWTSSTKDFDKNFEFVTYFAVSLVLFGYIAQFIGLRGLNAWISIAQLGITIIMSILRGILRMKRLDKSNNRLTIWQDLAAGHELDWLALDIAEQELTKELKNNTHDTSVEKDQQRIFEKKFLWYITGEHEKKKAVRLENVAVDGSGSETFEISPENGEYNNGRNDHLPKFNTAEWLVAYNDELIQNRIRLSNLTGHFGESMVARSYLSWKDERVRVRAKAKGLSAMISQAAVILLRNQSNKEDFHLRIKAAFSYDESNCEETIVSIKLKPPTGPDRINWGVDSSQLEAILGLWLWSMTRREYDTYSEKKPSNNNSSLPIKILNSKIFRVVAACHGGHEWDSSFDADMSLWLGSGDLKYVKQTLDVQSYNSYKYSLADHWIPSDKKSGLGGQDTNQTTKEDNESKSYERVGKSSNNSTAGFQRLCGWKLIYDALSTATFEEESNNTSERKRVNVKGFLVKDTDHSLLDICAQELFVALLHSMKALEFRKLDKISVSESGGNLRLENPVISALAKCFTDNGLGTHSDAISCLVPSLRTEIPPYQEKVLSALTPVASNYRRDEEWSSAEIVLSWACQYHHKLNPADTDETSDFMVALRELGELYRWSLAQTQQSVRQEFGLRGIEQMAAKFSPTNPIVARYSTVAERMNDTRIKSQGWVDEFHGAVMSCRRADALFNLCFAGNFIPHKLNACLLPAAQNGWDEILHALLEMKPSPNIKDGNDRTLVSHCAESGLRQSLQRLVDMNANLDLANKFKMTPLAYAAMTGREDIVRLLVQTGQVDLKGSGDSAERTPLWLAIDQNHFGIVTELLDKGADVSVKNYKVEGLLELAIRRGNSGMVKSLLERGLRTKWNPPGILSIDLQLWNEQSILWGRREDQFIEWVRLFKLPITVHPLTWAVWRGFTDITRLLLEDCETLEMDYYEVREARDLLLRHPTLKPLGNHTDGFFSTLDMLSLPAATIDGKRSIQFTPPYSRTPRIITGISGFTLKSLAEIDMCWEACHVSKTGFTLVQTKDWEKSRTMDYVEVMWIECDTESQEFQVGQLSIRERDDSTGKEIWFQNAFEQEPNVVVWLGGLYIRHETDRFFVDVMPIKITTKGFDLQITQPPVKYGGGIYITWLAYPPGSTHIQNGSLSFVSPHRGVLRRQDFAKKFKRTPRIFWAFSGFRIEGHRGVDIGIKICQIDATGFVWSDIGQNSEYILVLRPSEIQLQWIAFG